MRDKAYIAPTGLFPPAPLPGHARRMERAHWLLRVAPADAARPPHDSRGSTALRPRPGSGAWRPRWQGKL